jgi:hypothetical protein
MALWYKGTPLTDLWFRSDAGSLDMRACVQSISPDSHTKSEIVANFLEVQAAAGSPLRDGLPYVRALRLTWPSRYISILIFYHLQGGPDAEVRGRCSFLRHRPLKFGGEGKIRRDKPSAC